MFTKYLFLAQVLACMLFATNLILKKNLVNKLFNMILIYISSALIQTIFNNYFLGLTLIIVYVGAIMIFFLFVIMLLNTEDSQEIKTIQYLLFTALIMIVIFYQLDSTHNIFYIVDHSWYLTNTSNIKSIAYILAEKYSNLVLTIGSILFIIIVSIIKIFK